MEPEVLVAFVTAAGALVTALAASALGVWNARRVRDLEFIKSHLAREEARYKATLDYEYAAHRRIYERFEPAVFQLLELADYAVERIASLTDPKTWDAFVPAEKEPRRKAARPQMIQKNYAAVSTVYGLYAPMVIVRAMSRDLTMVDLSLERRIEVQYFLASRIYGSFKDDAKLAAIDPRLPYDPRNNDWRRKRRSDPARYWWQGLTMGRLEGVLDLLTVTGAHDGSERPATFGEFEKRWADIVVRGDEQARKTLAVASNALLGFTPKDRPILWRMLITQARLYQALLRTREDAFCVPTSQKAWKELLILRDREHFEWTHPTPDAPNLEETIAVTDIYLARMIEDAPRRLREGSEPLRADLPTLSRRRFGSRRPRDPKGGQ
jgi:hypothetical protein